MVIKIVLFWNLQIFSNVGFKELADRNDELVIETESLRALLKNQNKSEKGENIGSVGDVVGKIRSPTICKSASFGKNLQLFKSAGDCDLLFYVKIVCCLKVKLLVLGNDLIE